MSKFLKKFPVGARISYEDWGGYRETGIVSGHRLKKDSANDLLVVFMDTVCFDRDKGITFKKKSRVKRLVNKYSLVRKLSSRSDPIKKG